MIEVLRSSWPLLLGIGLLMVGNGLQGSLLGVRGDEAGFSTLEISIVMSAYFAGFLAASRVAPDMIRRVGHVRVFAALGSLVSAVLILFPAFPNPFVWILGRLLLGFCLCGVYVTAESWLNNAATNETRGQSLSLYMIVQMTGIIAAQGLLLIPDPTGFLLFVIPSVLVSIAFAPILLSISPTPAFETTKRMALKDLFNASPLGCVGMFLLGGVFAAQFGMSAVYGKQAGLSLQEISAFVSAFYIGALLCQYPLGWISDRADRRVLITVVAGIGGAAAALAFVAGHTYWVLLLSAFVIGGMSNPLYSLLIAYVNDYLGSDDMAAASAGLLFINGCGAIAGPLIIGQSMEYFGPPGFFLLVTALLTALTLYGLYRMTQRATPSVDATGVMTAFSPTTTPVAMEAAQEYAIEVAQDNEDASEAAEQAAAKAVNG